MILASGAWLLVAGVAGQPGPNENPPALLNGQAVTWTQLRDLLAETAGGAILEEVVLDRLLTQRCRRDGIKIDETTVLAEHERLLDVLDPDRQRAIDALAVLRQRRALGDRRFELLLKRNAMLRALIADQVDVTDAMIKSEYDLQFGPRYRVRLITTGTMADAQRALDEVHGGTAFADVAATMSTDAASAQRGGLLDAISPVDPSYPLSLRRVFEDLDVGDVSPIIPIETSFALVQMVERVPASTIPIEQVRLELARAARLAQERVLMDSLVREALSGAEIVVLDPALGDGWEARGGGR